MMLTPLCSHLCLLSIAFLSFLKEHLKVLLISHVFSISSHCFSICSWIGGYVYLKILCTGKFTSVQRSEHIFLPVVLCLSDTSSACYESNGADLTEHRHCGGFTFLSACSVCRVSWLFRNIHSPLCRRLEHCFKNTGFHSFLKSMTWLPLEGTEYRRHMKWKDILKGWDKEVHIVMECFQHFTA